MLFVSFSFNQSHQIKPRPKGLLTIIVEALLDEAKSWDMLRRLAAKYEGRGGLRFSGHFPQLWTNENGLIKSP